MQLGHGSEPHVWVWWLRVRSHLHLGTSWWFWPWIELFENPHAQHRCCVIIYGCSRAELQD
jgi:hypothetical protein